MVVCWLFLGGFTQIYLLHLKLFELVHQIFVDFLLVFGRGLRLELKLGVDAVDDVVKIVRGSCATIHLVTNTRGLKAQFFCSF